jgi:hypothetical protein
MEGEVRDEGSEGRVEGEEGEGEGMRWGLEGSAADEFLDEMGLGIRKSLLSSMHPGLILLAARLP